MKELSNNLMSAGVTPLDYDEYFHRFKQLERKHESWLKYAIENHGEKFSSTMFKIALLGILFCLIGGLVYFFSSEYFGDIFVKIGLFFFAGFILLFILGIVSLNWDYNFPDWYPDLDIHDARENTTFPDRASDMVDTLSGKFYLYCEAYSYQHKKTGYKTNLWGLFASESKGSKGKLISVWIDEP